MPEVKCSVSNCVFWEKSNRCGAESIMIDVDQQASKTEFLSEFAEEMYEDHHKDQAKKSSSTRCHTFKNKKD